MPVTKTMARLSWFIIAMALVIIGVSVANHDYDLGFGIGIVLLLWAVWDLYRYHHKKNRQEEEV